MTKAVFIDANILVADSAESAPSHAECERLLDRLHGSGAVLYISRQVLREVAATLTRPQAWTRGVPGDEVASELTRYAKLYRIAEESSDSTAQLLAYIRDGRAIGRQVHDANIVAVMKANKIGKLATLNGGDFAKFKNDVELIMP